jgi:membrane carboxypeptidase/penicillin-binding protein PbpC
MKKLCVPAIFFAAAFAVWLALPKPQLLDGISFSQCVRDRNGQLLRVTLSADQKFRVRTPLHEISPALIDATLRYEDKYYRHHPGVNPVALLRAAAHKTELPRSRCNWLGCVFICALAPLAESWFKLCVRSNWSGIIPRTKFLKLI